MGHTRGLDTSPPVGYKLEVERGASLRRAQPKFTLRRPLRTSRCHPTRAGRPEAARMHGALEVAALPARPSSQTGHRGADGSGPLAPGERRVADLGTRADRPRSARALVTIEASAMRVLVRGGGSPRQGG